MVPNTLMSSDYLREMVCEHCPATGWGKKARCQVHDKHVGMIDNCPEWDKFKSDHEGKVMENAAKYNVSAGLQPALDLISRTEDDIRDYPYMQIEVVRIQSYLREAGEGMVAQYGVDSAMPKAQGRNADKTHAEVVRRERKWNRLQNLQKKIARIDRAVESITDEQERLIVEALLDGDKNNVIAKVLGVSRQRYYEIKRSAVMKMAMAMQDEQEKKLP